MGDGHQHSHGDYGYLQHLLPQRLDAGSSRRRVAGEIVEVQGGHIMRSTGRKDRHSKVCTAKGPRDRRVRLSAHTAIQFYDVQDRLGYDRPSKAVDWLIKNAKAAIDELAELPPWRPAARTMDTDAEASYRMFGSTGILPPSLDSDAIADTIKAFFPVSTAGNPEDLRLSLQSLPEQPLAGNFHQNEQLADPSHHLVLDTAATGWPEQTIRIFPPATEMAGGSSHSSSAGGYAFSFPPPIPQPSPQGVAQLVHQVGGQSASAAQRGPLQSSDPVPYQSWVGHQTLSAMGDARFASFHVPARIQDGEERDGISNFPPTASRGRHPAC